MAGSSSRADGVREQAEHRKAPTQSVRVQLKKDNGELPSGSHRSPAGVCRGTACRPLLRPCVRSRGGGQALPLHVATWVEWVAGIGCNCGLAAGSLGRAQREPGRAGSFPIAKRCAATASPIFCLPTRHSLLRLLTNGHLVGLSPAWPSRHSCRRVRRRGIRAHPSCSSQRREEAPGRN